MHLPLNHHILAWCLLVFPLHALANTEIINFAVKRSEDVVDHRWSEWDTLSSKHPQRQLVVPPAPLGTSLRRVCEGFLPGECRHERWVALDLDEPTWNGFSKFTLRISWPASNPADFLVETFTSSSLVSAFYSPDQTHLSSKPLTRRQYARIRVLNTGVHTPSQNDSMAPPETEPIPFSILLEPLYFGVLPKSVVPILLFLFPLVIVTFAILPAVHHYLSGVAEIARKEFVLQRHNRVKDD